MIKSSFTLNSTNGIVTSIYNYVRIFIYIFIPVFLCDYAFFFRFLIFIVFFYSPLLLTLIKDNQRIIVLLLFPLWDIWMYYVCCVPARVCVDLFTSHELK